MKPKEVIDSVILSVYVVVGACAVHFIIGWVFK